VRWDNLFDDLEAQLDQLAEAELAGEVAERSRIEVSKFGLVDRLRPAIGQPVSVTVPGAPAVVGTLSGVGGSWLLVAESRGPEVLVPMAAATSVAGLGNVSAVPGSAGRVAERLTLAHALRGIARDRSGVAVGLLDGIVLTGTIDRVGADFFEIAEHAIDEARRRGNVAGLRTVPIQAVALIRRTL
jgi:hypothetical protein